MENKSIKNRLYQALGSRSPKHPFLLQDTTNNLAPILKPKKIHDLTATTHGKPAPVYKQGKLLLKPVHTPEVSKKRPVEVAQERLSKEAKSMLDEGKNRIRSNLRPHDIFQLYDNFPEMMEDFFYLNRLQHPYDYQIVTYSNRNQAEYMTISSQGVTLYHDKEAEFLSRQAWLSDEKRYYALQRICFFKQYKLSKNFRIWKNKMRRHYMREMSGILNENLFLTIDYPRRCLLEVKCHTNYLKDNIPFFPYDNLEKLTPEEFVELLEEHRQKTLLKGVRDVTEHITQKLVWAVTEEINKFKIENNIKIEAVNEGQSGNKEGYVYSQEAILKKKYKKVYKLIKLADSILQEAKIEMIIKCLEQLLEKIKQLQSEDKQPWLTCSAYIEEDGSVTWEPNCQALSSLFLDAIKKHVKCLNEQNVKIINNPIFARYKMADYGQSKTEENRNSLKGMVEESPSYFPLLRQIEDVLVSEFNKTETEEEQLQKFIEIYRRHKQLGDMNRIFKENNAVDLCINVDQWKHDEREMAELSEDKKGELLLYNYAVFRKNIINLPKQTLINFFSLLPSETSSRCMDLVTECYSLLNSISVYPTEIYSFAGFSKSVKLAGERLEDIRSAGSQICLMVDLMGKNKLGNLELYNTKKIEVLNSISALKSKVEESEAKQNESLSRFKRQNETEIAKIKASVKDLEGKFNSIEFNQIQATPRKMKQILAKIGQIMPTIKALEVQSLRITQIETELNMVVTNFQEVHQLYENTLLVHDTWSCRDEWKSLLVNLYHKHYCEVNCEELKKKWEWFSNKVHSLMKSLPENQILKNLLQELGEVEVLIQTIAALRCPTLEDKSWREISEYLAYELGIDNEDEFPFKNIANPSYTVKWLLQINISVYKEKIEFIVRKSEKEKELIVQLGQCKNYISNLVFEIVQKKNEFYIFAENREVQAKLHQNLALLYSMLGNQYSQSVQNESETLIKHYEYTEELMKAALDFTLQWCKYETYFDGTSGSLKLLAKESKEFANWQLQWKKIIKMITSDSVSFYRKVCDETLGVNCSRSTMKQVAKINGGMEQVKRGLDEFLEKKRATFPRYCFISDEQLLMMFANLDNKEPITAHFVPVIYKHIQRINYREDTKDTLLSIVSKEGQQFELKQVSFKLQSQMEDIFKLTEEQIKKRMSDLIKSVFIRYSQEEISRQKMILENNTQVVLAIDFIAWVRLAEETYLCPEPIGDLYDWLSIQHEQIKELSRLMSSQQDKIGKYKLLQFMCQSIYMREKTEALIKNNISSTDCYEWERIPKICMAGNNSDINFRQLGHKLAYCYQFLGSSPISMIEPETERVWLNVAQAISTRDIVCLGYGADKKMETVRKLGWMIAQEVQQVNIGEQMNFNVLEKFVNGGVYTGEWIVFNWPQTEQMLAFLATQISNAKKIMAEATLEKNKNAISSNPNSAFFLAFDKMTQCNIEGLMTPFSHRAVTLHPPNLERICQLLAESHGQPAELASKVVRVCNVMKECFEFTYCQVFDRDFVTEVMSRTIKIIHSYDWLRGIKCKEYYEYIVCESLDQLLLPKLQKDDSKVYETLKTSMVPNYEKFKLRHPSHYQSQLQGKIKKFLEGTTCCKKNNAEYISKLELFVTGVTSSKIGVVLVGQPLCGKSTLVNLAVDFMRSQSKEALKVHRIYHKAYSSQDVFENDKTPVILTQSMNDLTCQNWVIFDGKISQQYLELFGRDAQIYVVPSIGVFTADPKMKFVCETYDISNVSPAIVGNHEIVSLGEGLLTSDQMVRTTVAELQLQGKLVNLSPDAVEWLVGGLISSLSKVQSKSIFKSKLISFAYPISNMEITFRCLRLMKAIFKLNWESIRDKEKNAKKMIDRFVSWLVYWSLVGVVFVDDESKYEKLVVEVTKNQNSINQELGNCIVYPNCGLEVQVISGLRTQSSLGIPERGIITNLLRTDLLGDSEITKNNKFFQQIVISEALLIRVNYSESNKYNYIAQMSSITDTPTMLIGPQNSGKKTITELYAKNMRGKTQFYSIRYRNRESLTGQIEKPFRRLNGLKGIVMKSTSASKQLVVCVEDLNLDMKNQSTSELLRMLFNEKGYFNKQAQWLNFDNCSFSLITSKLATSPDNLRLLPRVNLFQTAANTAEKLHSIYYPYLKNWSAFNGLGGDLQRVFSSQNGDTILDSIISVYKLLDGMYKEGEKDSIESLLVKPRIGDIAKVLTYICRTPEAGHYNMDYYYELWAHEVLRVFGDRLLLSSHKEEFYKQMKKEALVKFKQNFSVNEESLFNFTSLGIENDNCYIRVEDPSFLHNYISNLLQSDQISLPLKFLFGELISYLLRIHRVMTVEGSHLLLLSHNQKTANYLIKLACQVSQSFCYDLNKEVLSVDKHIEPTLFFKENACFTEKVANLGQDAIYQLACLLNGNVYDFQMSSETKEKVKSSLNKKEKIDTGKKESKAYGKTAKLQQLKQEQKEEDLDILMMEQFMSLAHFILQTSPLSGNLRAFLKTKADIVGKLHFSWIDIPGTSLVNVSKQILSFDQEIQKLKLEGQDDEALIQKVKKIYQAQSPDQMYFNDFMIICENVKSEGVRLGNHLNMRIKEIEQGKYNWLKIRDSITEKQTMMKCIQDELDETNAAVEEKSVIFEGANSKLNEMQLASSSDDPNDQLLNALKAQKEATEADFKTVKDKKDRLETEKKKILKGIKIGNDYLQLFNNSYDIFDTANKVARQKKSLLHDKLIITWCAISFLPKVPATEWLKTINGWLDIVESRIPRLADVQDIVSMMNELMPQPQIRKDIFCPESELKIKTVLWMLHYYEQTSLYGGIMRVYDPKGLLPTAFQRLSSNVNSHYHIFKTFDSYNRELRSEVETFCKTRNGVIVFEKEENIDELEGYFIERKMVNYFNKIIVYSSEQKADICLYCVPGQLQASVEDFTLKLVISGMHTQRQLQFQQLVKEEEKKEENSQLLFRACANINEETETYGEEVAKYKGQISSHQQTINSIRSEMNAKKYLSLPELGMVSQIATSLEKVWHREGVDFRYLENIHQAALRLKYGGQYEQMSQEEKAKQLEKIIEVTLGQNQGTSLQEQLAYCKKWNEEGRLLLLTPCRLLLSELEQQKYQLVNLLTLKEGSGDQSEPKVYYNFMPHLHNSLLGDLIKKEKYESQGDMLRPLILMAPLHQIDSSILKNNRVIVVANKAKPLLQFEEGYSKQEVRGMENVRRYLRSISKNRCHQEKLIEYIDINCEKCKDENELVTLISESADIQTTNLVKELLQCEGEKLNQVFASLKVKKQKANMMDQNGKKIMVSANIQEQLPFTFNLSEFHSSKDALSTDLISECIAFNKSIKLVREQLKKNQYEWEVEEDRFEALKEETIAAMNQSYSLLKKNLIKMQVLATSHKVVTNKGTSNQGLNFHKVLNLPDQMINARTLCLLKCRATKKFKTGLFNIGLVWKVPTSTFSFEQTVTSSDLCLSVQAKVQDYLKVLTGELAREDDDASLMEVMVCPVVKSHESKSVNQIALIPLKREESVLGMVEISRGDLDVENLLGMDQLSLRLEVMK